MSKSESINGDMSKYVSVDTNQIKWQESPSGSVWRKRLHLVGPAEAGQVTSLVMYEANSDFHAHAHPGGEEILVLGGTFSDERGDFKAGTYLLNPEGYEHTPFSKEGGFIFVKLRQYPGNDRTQIVVDTQNMKWIESLSGIHIKMLYSEHGYAEEVSLQKWDRGASPGEVHYPGGAEILILKGDLKDERGTYGEMSWIRLPEGSVHNPVSPSGCEFYIKRGGVSSLDSL
ncbi:MAG: cupin domain-containing protein [Thermodesulfobacteriota bacterium]